ncbi:hypothetical protein D3C86_1527430 [compost metagenome]
MRWQIGNFCRYFIASDIIMFAQLCPVHDRISIRIVGIWFHSRTWSTWSDITICEYVPRITFTFQRSFTNRIVNIMMQCIILCYTLKMVLWVPEQLSFNSSFGKSVWIKDRSSIFKLYQGHIAIGIVSIILADVPFQL